MTKSAILGFPRTGEKRELKKALETFWRKEISEDDLLATGKTLRETHWRLQQTAGIDIIPSGDFSFYDHVLDMTATLGAVPDRFNTHEQEVSLDTYFAMARGTDGAVAMEMTKWFDTNYHYIVPEFKAGQEFKLSSNKYVNEFLDAKSLGIHTRPVIIGPVTYLLLGKSKDENLSDTLDLLPAILPAYKELLRKLKLAGADWVQIDEPMLCLVEREKELQAYKTAYNALSGLNLDLLIATYFEGVENNLELINQLTIQGLHIDLVRAPDQLSTVLDKLSNNKVLSLGLVDGRNIWRSDLSKKLETLKTATNKWDNEQLHVTSSCSLIHVPVDLENESKLDHELKSWLAFAVQKLHEVSTLASALRASEGNVRETFLASDKAAQTRRTSKRIHNPIVEDRLQNTLPSDFERVSSFDKRRKLQQNVLNLPAYPTTTIGSFPQTLEVRKARAAHKRGELSTSEYESYLKTETETAIRIQEDLEIDVLVHGEFERNDMVEYFGEQLDGFAFTQFGWVQSYGSRYVKPPIIYGDVHRQEPMTVKWSEYAQSLTKKPMKGMLTGPVTILQWSFVRDDQPRSTTCEQIALAIRDEVLDLEKSGIKLIQIDEPALREGLPLRAEDHQNYLDWAVNCFRLAAAGVADSTQIHTHMCYSEFNDIMPSIAALDADVISIETSRSDMELLDVFKEFSYPNEIGPGVYDIHSPRLPSIEEISLLLQKAGERLKPDQIWVNPDCGLKTRTWDETIGALKNMVTAAKLARAV